jgi:hypothetical protein
MWFRTTLILGKKKNPPFLNVGGGWEGGRGGGCVPEAGNGAWEEAALVIRLLAPGASRGPHAQRLHPAAHSPKLCENGLKMEI